MVEKVPKGETFYVQINTFSSTGASENIVGGSAYVTEATSATRYGSAATIATASTDTGVSRIAVNTQSSLFSRGKQFFVWLNSASVGGVVINGVVGKFEVDTHVLMRTGVVSANASTVVISGNVDANNRFAGGTIRIYQGTGSPSPAHVITSTSADDNRIKVNPAFGAAPDTTSRVEILATEYIENLEYFPADVRRVRSVSVDQFTGPNWVTFFNNGGASSTFTLGENQSNVADILLDTGTDGVIVQQHLSAAVDDILNQSLAELTTASAPPNWGAMTLRDGLSWLIMRGLNRHTQSSTATEIYSSAGGAIASASVAFTTASANQAQWL